MLTARSYIKSAGVIGDPLNYQWRPYQGTELIEAASKHLAALINAISLNANVSLLLGIAEWMMWRLDSPTVFPQLALYVDALWARAVDKAYLKVNKVEVPPDTGDPLVGPLRALQKALYPAFGKAVLYHPERGLDASGIVSLVRYTLTDPAPFDDWLRVTLERFTEHFRLDPHDRNGPIVPRAFLDPEVPIHLAHVSRLLDEQLRQIEWVGNPFLATPEEMCSAKFKGTPYRYLP